MRLSLLSAICSMLLLAYVLHFGRYSDCPPSHILISSLCSHLTKAGLHSLKENFIRVLTMGRVKKRSNRSTFSNLQFSKYSFLSIIHSCEGWFVSLRKSMAALWLRFNSYHTSSILHALFHCVHINCAMNNWFRIFSDTPSELFVYG